jgi:hypothetical protein
MDAMSELDVDRTPRAGDPALDDDPDKVAHIVRQWAPLDEQTAVRLADVTSAYIEGTPLTALCGHVWVPSRDPRNLPPCSRCIAAAEAMGLPIPSR